MTNTFNFDGLPADRLKAMFAKNGYLSIFGSYDVLKNAISINHVNKNMPSFLVLIAEAEQFQPPILASAREFAAAAERAGSRVNFEVLKDRTHYETINKMVNIDDPTLLRIIKFIGEHGPEKKSDIVQKPALDLGLTND